MGRNGAGKSTLLCGARRAARRTQRHGDASAASDPATLRPRDLVRQVGAGAAGAGRPALRRHGRRRVRRAPTGEAGAPRRDGAGAARPACSRRRSAAMHPRDLSEGQRLALALAVVLTGRAAAAAARRADPRAGLRRARSAWWRCCASSPPTGTPSCWRPTTSSWSPSGRPGGGAGRRRGRRRRPDRRGRRRLAAFAPQVAKILAPQPWLTVGRGRGGAGGRDERLGGRRRAVRAVRAPAARGRPLLVALTSSVGLARVSAGRCSSTPGAAARARRDAPWLFVAAAAAAARRRARRDGRRRDGRQGASRCSACSPRSAPRCARSAAASPASSRCSSCSCSAAGCFGPGFGFVLGAVTLFAVGAAHRAASGRGCRSRCSAPAWVGLGRRPACRARRAGRGRAARRLRRVARARLRRC